MQKYNLKLCFFNSLQFNEVSWTAVALMQVCTGHSLGGGTAAILAILLREEYQDITAYAFSPPGGLLR